MKRLLLPVLILILASGLCGLQFAKWHTSMGDFTCELYDDQTPITAGNFITLANSGFYNNLIFHRVVANFVIQDGDPLGTGYGGPGYTIQDEFYPGFHHDQAGILAMARTSAPNSAGSQYYITLAPAPHLDGSYAIFGKVIEGLDTVLQIGQVATNANGLPLTPVNILTLSIVDLDIGTLTPPNDSPVYAETGVPQTFIVEATSQNGGETFAWYIDDQLQTGQADFIFESAFTSGAHVVKCRVSQGTFSYDILWNVQSSSEAGDPTAPAIIGDLSAHPNPFTKSTTLSFDLKETSLVEISVFDLRGRKLKNSGFKANAGMHEWSWDAKNSLGDRVPAGKYILRVKTPKSSRALPIIVY